MSRTGQKATGTSRRRGAAAAVALLIAAPALAALAGTDSATADSAAATAPLTPYVAAIHVHSVFSNGEYDVMELARLASDRGVEILVLTDSFLTTVSYGVWPLDRIGIAGINKLVRPGVLDYGVGRYLAAIREARQRYPDLLILAGVEVAPSYYWKGRPWSGLSLYDFDRHLLVLGLSERELRNLPVIGNERWANTGLRWRLLVLPTAVILAGVALLRVRRSRTIRMRNFNIRQETRYRKTALTLLLLGVLTAWNNYPFGALADPYAGEHDNGPYQRLIDYVRERDGVVYWSYPEADYPEVTAGGATMISRSHPEDLLRTDRYHGFEGLYGNDIPAIEPGNVWDEALLAYLRGERETPPFVITGLDFHVLKGGGEAWDDLDGGQTLLLLPEKTEEAVLEALRNGRGYSTFMAFEEKLRLRQFILETGDGARATHGQEIRGRSPVTVRFSLDWVGSAPEDANAFKLQLVRNGEVVERFHQELPIEVAITEELRPGRYYYRLLADSHRLNRVLTNPVFVTVD